MKARATTRVSILRGTATDTYGDTVDNSTVVASGVTASLIEQRHTSRRRDEREPRTMRYFALRVPAGTDLRRGDRIRDEKTSTVYIVDDFDQPTSPIRTLDLTAELRRIT